MSQYQDRIDDAQSILTDCATLVGSPSSEIPPHLDNASIHTYRSSTSTLRPLPRQHSAPLPINRIAGSSSNGPIDEQSLTVPWWTAVLPNPTSVLQRNRNQRRTGLQNSLNGRDGGGGGSDGVTDSHANDGQQNSVSLLRNRRTSLIGRSISNNSSPSSSNDSTFSRFRGMPRSVSTPHSLSIMDRSGASNLNFSTSTRRRVSSASEERPDISTTIPSPPELLESYDKYTKCYCEENAYILAAHLNRTCQERNRIKTNETKKSWHWYVDVIFVSNSNKNVALWQQRASQMPETDNIVIWDYHVFVVVTCRTKIDDGIKSTQRLKNARSLTNLRNRLPSRSTRPQTLNNTNVVTDYSNIETVHSPRSESDREGSPPIGDSIQSHSWVYDLDSCLSSPVPLSTYLKSTFKSDIRDSISIQFRPQFRIIPALAYLAFFASDRSHMVIQPTAEEIETHQAISASVGWINEDRLPRRYSSPPPEWPCIRGRFAEQDNVLMDSYVSMDQENVLSTYGSIASLNDLIQGAKLCGDDRTCLADVTNSRNGSDSLRLEGEDFIDLSVLRMIDNLRSDLNFQDNRRHRSRSNENRTRADSSSSNESMIIAEEEDDVDDEESPGFLIGVRRIYGVRPPPPVPEGEDRFAKVDFTGRGKRVTNPLFPAYMHATLQSRAAQRQSQTNQSQNQVISPPPPPLPST